MARILIAEDDATTRLQMVRLARKMGHEVLQSSNGRRAWELLEDNPDVQLLVTDVVMPEMDGTALISKLRGDARFGDLPILIVSHHVGVKDVARFLDNGATAFLRKPLEQKELADYIARYVEGIDLA
ncbi:MAG TPA: response regulator [Deltaproteobacteria bacterium]|nr:response regulator [Deltaproteobacteria bacterium]